MPPGLFPGPCPGIRIGAVLPVTVMLAFRDGTMIDKSSERPSADGAVGGPDRGLRCRASDIRFHGRCPESISSSLYITPVKPGVPCAAVPALHPRRFGATRSSSWNFVESAALSPGSNHNERGQMAVNKPTGDNARKGAVKKRSQTKTTLAGASAWTKRNRSSGEFMALKRPSKKKAAKKFKGVRTEKRARQNARAAEAPPGKRPGGARRRAANDSRGRFLSGPRKSRRPSRRGP
jgi:hypothetical protein